MKPAMTPESIRALTGRATVAGQCANSIDDKYRTPPAAVLPDRKWAG